ncbi:type ISP restriction/modification enzyme [Helicobacter sp. MIT 99-5507]|uniref:type ISP restriction/modification enzyme n=1 Tax=Helicobacter sp. MIT 99-5507 TaxID=152489 RepID=UPI0026BEB4B5
MPRSASSARNDSTKRKRQESLFDDDDIFQGKDKIENFTPTFRDFIDSKYGEHFSPEAILGYIYAVLFHKDYREKYLDFLKIDFPKILFAESKEKFLALSELGARADEITCKHKWRIPDANTNANSFGL